MTIAVAVKRASCEFIPRLTTFPASFLQVYNAKGQFLRYIGDGKGAKPGRFDHPWGVAIDDSSTYVFVSDRYNHRIQVSSGANGVGCWEG